VCHNIKVEGGGAEGGAGGRSSFLQEMQSEQVRAMDSQGVRLKLQKQMPDQIVAQTTGPGAIGRINAEGAPGGMTPGFASDTPGFGMSTPGFAYSAHGSTQGSTAHSKVREDGNAKGSTAHSKVRGKKEI
jgi:hypothetical protein